MLFSGILAIMLCQMITGFFGGISDNINKNNRTINKRYNSLFLIIKTYKAQSSKKNMKLDFSYIQTWHNVTYLFRLQYSVISFDIQYHISFSLVLHDFSNCYCSNKKTWSAFIDQYQKALRLRQHEETLESLYR